MRITVDDTYLTNIPTGCRVPPHGDLWKAYLFCRHLNQPYHRRFVQTLEARTKAALTRKILKFVRQRGVKLGDPEKG